MQRPHLTPEAPARIDWASLLKHAHAFGVPVAQSTGCGISIVHDLDEVQPLPPWRPHICDSCPTCDPHYYDDGTVIAAADDAEP